MTRLSLMVDYLGDLPSDIGVVGSDFTAPRGIGSIGDIASRHSNSPTQLTSRRKQGDLQKPWLSGSAPWKAPIWTPPQLDFA